LSFWASISALINNSILKAAMSTNSFKKESEIDEKNVAEISHGVTFTIAEDTVEAAHQCMSKNYLTGANWTIADSTSIDTDAEFKRIRFKTDLYLMPMLWILGGLCMFFSAFTPCNFH
jgi:hypothetical protein